MYTSLFSACLSVYCMSVLKYSLLYSDKGLLIRFAPTVLLQVVVHQAISQIGFCFHIQVCPLLYNEFYSINNFIYNYTFPPLLIVFKHGHAVDR